MTDDGGVAPCRIVWRNLDADQAAELWEELAEWVEWMRTRFGFTHQQVPACWFQHPPLVEVLTALMYGWKAAYHTTDDAWGWYRHEPIAFLVHEFWPTIAHLKSVSDFGGCKPQACEYFPVVVETHYALAEVIAADVDARR